MESVTLASRRSSGFLSVAAAVLLVLAAALFLGGCAIEDNRTSVADENEGHSTAFTQTSGWTTEDPVRPRKVPTPRSQPQSAAKPEAKPKGRSAT